jgi:hypothetical protein
MCRFCLSPFDINTESRKAMQEAVVATHKTKSRKIVTKRAASFAVLGLTGLAGMEQVVSAFGCLFGAPLNMALETLPSILMAAWHMLQPCALGHLGLLERLLQIPLSWQVVLTLTGA